MGARGISGRHYCRGDDMTFEGMIVTVCFALLILLFVYIVFSRDEVEVDL